MEEKCKEYLDYVINYSKEHIDENVLMTENFVVKWNKWLNKKFYNLLVREEKILRDINEYSDLGPKMYMSYSVDNRYYIFMENLESMGFRSLTYLFDRKNGKYTASPKDVKNIITSITSLHSMGIAHRDLHCGNIFYCLNTSRVKFIDFEYSTDLFENLDIELTEDTSQDHVGYLTSLQEKWCSLGFGTLRENFPTSREIFYICAYISDISWYLYLFSDNEEGTLEEVIQYGRWSYEKDTNFSYSAKVLFKEYNTYVDNSDVHMRGLDFRKFFKNISYSIDR